MPKKTMLPLQPTFDCSLMFLLNWPAEFQLLIGSFVGPLGPENSVTGPVNPPSFQRPPGEWGLGQGDKRKSQNPVVLWLKGAECCLENAIMCNNVIVY